MGFGDMMGKVGKGIAKYGPELLQRGASGVYAGRTGDIPGAQRMNSNYAMQKRAQAMQAELSQLGDLNAATLPKVGEIMLKHGFQDKYMDVVAMVQKGEDQKFRHNLATAEFGQKERELNMEMLDAGRPDEQHYAALRRDAWKEVST